MGLSSALIVGFGVWLTGQVPGPPQDAIHLIERLGAARYADREEATESLLRLGREALPALREARQAEDPEIRERVRGLIAQIESDRMVQATMVSLDYVDRPVPEVTASLSQSSGIPFQLMPDDPAFWQGRRITLQAEGPVPFWTALDRLCEAAQVRPTADLRRGSGLWLTPGQVVSNAPKSDRGPFRSMLLGIHYQRDRNFAGASQGAVEAALVIGANGRPVPNIPRLPVPNDEGGTETFYADLQIQVEPRMVVSQAGMPQLVTAIDDRGQSLLPPSDPSANAAALRSSSFASASNGTVVQIQLPLSYPAQPGQVIRALEGTVPVTVSARKDEPLVIALDNAVGKTFQSEEVAITIHAVEANAAANNNNQPGAAIDLSIAPTLSSNPLGEDEGIQALPSLLMLRQQGLAQQQIEIVDAQGQLYRQWFPRSSQMLGDEVRMTLALMPMDGVGPPAELRVYGMARIATEVHFHFKDVPMP